MDISSAPGLGPASAGQATAPRSAPESNAKTQSLGEQLNGIAGVSTEKSLYGEKKGLDKDAFLKMFMEQLKYQDPMNPMKNDQFTQQMAQFSQLEQSLATNKNLEKIISQQNNMQVAALQLVGKNITADRSGLYHDKGKITGMSFKIPTDMSNVRVEIVDPAGEVAKTYQIGDRGAGDVNWKWDGLRENGIPADSGRYTYRVKGKGLDGKETTINTKVDGKVSGVTSSSGVVYLLIGEQKIALNDVETIKEAGSSDQNINAKPAVFRPAGQSDGAGVKRNADNAREAPDGSIAGLGMGSSDNTESQEIARNARASSGMNPESETNRDTRGDQLRDESASQNWDRMNPLMPLYSR